jgi:hypothetical protein
MKDVIKSVLLIETVTPSLVLATDFSGARIGLGYSQTELLIEQNEQDLFDGDYGQGIKLELANDFNRYLGISAAYIGNQGSVESSDIEGVSKRLGFDLGYLFSVQSASIKPYAQLGYQSYKEESGSGFDKSQRVREYSAFYGAGLRFYYQHFYSDLSVSYFNFEEFSADYQFQQVALSLGYKF